MTKMKLKVVKSGRIHPQTKVKGYAARAVTSGMAGFDEIVAEACHNTTMHRAEAKVAFELCMETVVRMLMQGYIIDLGPLGRLYPKCSSAWVERAEDLLIENVVPSIHYRPTKAMDEAVRGAKLQWTAAKKTTRKGRSEGDDAVGQ